MTDSLGVAFVIGIAFGFALEGAALGNAPKLARQFYLSDFTVFKVMFSAVVTAMLGVFWLSQIGLVDLAAIHVPETFLLPQIAGGVIFGLGFVASGLCPGTSCVAAATGRADGIAAMTGVLAGVVCAGFAVPAIEPFFSAGSRGVFTLPEAFGLPYGVTVAVIVALALTGFAASERLERRT
jgi:uncharacterized membrane protein YedE/YeeE